MAKYYGTVGFAVKVQTNPGVWVDEVQERPYQGDLIKDSYRYQSSGAINDNINIDNQIRIIADPYAFENMAHIKWIELHGTKWKVSSTQISYPNITLNLGGVFNE